MAGTKCEYCANYVYDEECEYYVCDIDLDEDEYGIRTFEKKWDFVSWLNAG